MNIGQILGKRFEVGKCLCQTREHRVYVARDKKMNCLVAVKEELEEKRTAFYSSLENEIQMLAGIHHPNIVKLYASGNYEGHRYLVEEYVSGKNLCDICREKGPASEEEVLFWAYQTASALKHLHDMKPPVIYRDVKPSNIMVNRDGLVKLLDFGIAKRYRVREDRDEICFGTEGYAAPEQYANGSQSDVRSDIYGLGVTMYALLSARNPEDIYIQKLSIREFRPDVSEELAQIIHKAIMRDPDRRFQSMDSFLFHLEKCMNRKEPEINKAGRFRLGALVVTAAAMLVTAVVIRVLDII